MELPPDSSVWCMTRSTTAVMEVGRLRCECHVPGGHIAHAPCRLQVESACDSIHIEDFSGKVKSRMLPAFHG